MDNSVYEMTVSPTKGDDNAMAEFLDKNAVTVADAHTTKDGHQAALDLGETTIKVKVTA